MALPPAPLFLFPGEKETKSHVLGFCLPKNRLTFLVLFCEKEPVSKGGAFCRLKPMASTAKFQQAPSACRFAE